MGVHTVFRKQGKLRSLSAAWVACQFWPQGKWECDDDGPQTTSRRGFTNTEAQRQAKQTQRLRGRPHKHRGSEAGHTNTDAGQTQRLRGRPHKHRGRPHKHRGSDAGQTNTEAQRQATQSTLKGRCQILLT